MAEQLDGPPSDPRQDAALLRRTMQRIRLPLVLTRIGMFAERAARAFWPLWTLLIAVLAA